MQIAARRITRVLSLIAFLIVARIGYGLVVDYLEMAACLGRGGQYIGESCVGASAEED